VLPLALMTSLPDQLGNYALVWDRKPVLRVIYEDFTIAWPRSAEEATIELCVPGAGGAASSRLPRRPASHAVEVTR
jgi:hypothetical protein